LILTHRAYPSTGGIEFTVHHTLDYLAQNDLNLEILNLAFTDTKSTTERVGTTNQIVRIHSFSLFGGYYPLPFPWEWWRLWRKVNQFKPDLINTHNRYVDTTWFGQLYAWFNCIPLVHTEHASAGNRFASWYLTALAAVLDSTLVWLLLRTVTRMVAVSESAKSFLTNRFGIKQVTVIKDFISPLAIEKAIHTPLPWPELARDARLKVVFAYRLVESKGYQFFLDLVKNNTNEQLLFIMAGDGPGKGAVEALVAQNRPDFRYLGKLSHEENLHLLKLADVVCNFSELEGLSTTIMEAMYFNKYVVASDIEPNREVLQNYIKKWLGPLTIEAIQAELAHLSTQGISKNKEPFPQDMIAEYVGEQYQKLYSRLLEKR